jgi:uncharacterized protein (TIGR00251 family)
MKLSNSNAEASCTLAVRVAPGARRDGLVREGEGWKVQVAAPPVDGKANDHLCEFMAREVLGLPKRAVRVKIGSSGRSKILEIDAPRALVDAALSAWENKG